MAISRLMSVALITALFCTQVHAVPFTFKSGARCLGQASGQMDATDLAVVGPSVAADCDASRLYNSTIANREISGVSVGSADLNQGALRASSSAQSFRSGLNFESTNTDVVVTLGDTLTFGMDDGSGTLAALNSAQDVTIRMTVEGQGSADPTQAFSFMFADLRLFPESSSAAFDRVSIGAELFDTADGWQDRTGSQPVAGTGAFSVVSTAADNYLAILEATFTVGPGAALFGVEATLGTSSRGSRAFSQTAGQLFETISDFGNTAFLDVIMPVGLGFTSASGEFLAGRVTTPPPPVGVSQPASLWLLTGLFLLLWRQRQG